MSLTWRITSWSASRGLVSVVMMDGTGRKDGRTGFAHGVGPGDGDRYDPSLSHPTLRLFPRTQNFGFPNAVSARLTPHHVR